MAAKTPEMTTDFARWYLDSFMTDGVTRDMRWKGVIDIAAKAEFQVVEVLVRLAFPSKVPASGTKNENLSEHYQTVLTTISGSDVAVDPTHNARELQVLAAAALVEAFKRSPDAALAVSTASFGGARKPDLPMDLGELAEAALGDLSRTRRDRVDTKTVQVAAAKLDFAVSAQAQQSMDAATWKVELERLRDNAATAINTLVTSQNRALNALNRQMTLDQEELQILWWLIGGYSEVGGADFDKIPAKARPLLLGYELGDLTNISPGPASIKAILSRAGVSSAGLAIQDAVNAADLEWAMGQSESKGISPVTTPVHFALEKRAELGTTDSWQAGWAGVTGLPGDASMPADQLGVQFYREHLFLHVGQ
jgi:hypothetical protein